MHRASAAAAAAAADGGGGGGGGGGSDGEYVDGSASLTPSAPQLTRYFCEGEEQWVIGSPEEDEGGGVVLMSGDV